MPEACNGRREIGVGECGALSASQQAAQVMALVGKEAGVELAFGRQAGAVAVAAEGLTHAGNDADLAAAVGIGPAAGGFAGGAGGQGTQWQLGGDAAQDVIGG